MKTLVIILSAIGLLSLNSCNQKTDPSTMLENSETRTELFDALISNHDYMTEFMDNMQGNNHAMQMIQGNKKMMGNMMKMMHEKGMMSDECMLSCMKMMGEKGMDMKEMNKMENMDSPTINDHTEHH